MASATSSGVSEAGKRWTRDIALGGPWIDKLGNCLCGEITPEHRGHVLLGHLLLALTDEIQRSTMVGY